MCGDVFRVHERERARVHSLVHSIIFFHHFPNFSGTLAARRAGEQFTGHMRAAQLIELSSGGGGVGA